MRIDQLWLVPSPSSNATDISLVLSAQYNKKRIDQDQSGHGVQFPIFAEAPESPMQQPCNDAGENVQRCKGKPTEALVCCLWAWCYGDATLLIHPSEAGP